MSSTESSSSSAGSIPVAEKKRTTITIRTKNNGDSIAVDEDDYNLVRSLFQNNNNNDNLCRDSIKIHDSDQDRRIWGLRLGLDEVDLDGLPFDEIANTLTGLERLDLQGFQEDTVIPPTIGLLQSLRELHLTNHTTTGELSALPREIGHLTRLTKLRLWGIRELPPAIGQLQNLEELVLRCESMPHLPAEIGDCAGLKKLDLAYSGITSLPASIGKLKNLEVLDLFQCEQLLGLPEEIGDLSSLQRLYLNCSGIQKIPAGIGRLQNIRELRIGYSCNDWKALPEELGNLTSLQTLSIDHLAIDVDENSSLDDIWIWKLKNLRELGLSGLQIPRLEQEGTNNHDFENYLLGVVRHRLFFLDTLWLGWNRKLTSEGRNNLSEALRFNRIRRMCPFICIHNNYDSSLREHASRKLWPRTLRHATKVFEPCRQLAAYSDSTPPNPTDSIHALLRVGMESFLHVLEDRRRRK